MTSGSQSSLRKWMMIGVAAVALGSGQAALAQHRGGGGGNGGGGHWSGGHSGGMHNGGSWRGDGGFNGWRGGDRGRFDGGHWGGPRFYGSRWHGAPYFASFGLFLGAPYFWGPGYYPYSTSYPGYVTYPTAVYYPSSESGAPEPSYQYYCPGQGYYPAVQTCPSGWQRVLPEHAPSY
jgi:hypothetical protein